MPRVLTYRINVGILIYCFTTLLLASNPPSEGFQIDQVGPMTTQVDLNTYQKVVYVSVSTGTDQAGLGSRDLPWRSLVYAISQITDASLSKKYAILVGEGIYSNGTMMMKEYVDLYGGFSVDNWSRDIHLFRSVLDGRGVYRVVEGASNAHIDGFTITSGLSRSYGAGILCWDTSPSITNNVIIRNLVLEPENFDHTHMYQKGNHGGGIASLYNSVPVIRNNLIMGNRTSAGYGGGVVFYGLFRMSGVAEPDMQDNRLEGGIQPVLENNVIVENISGINDLQRTRSSSGGGIACAIEARPIIRNNIVAHNQALGRSDAGGIYSEYFSYPLIENNWILGNICDDDGGGLYTTHQGQPLIRENIFAGNWTYGGGCGGVRLSKEGRVEVIDNIIIHNPGGGVMVVDSWIRLERNIIMYNEKGSGFTYNQNFSYFIPSVLRSNVIRENEKGSITIMNQVGQPFLLEQNNVSGGDEYPGNFDHDPGLIDDGLKGTVKSAEYDEVRYLSIILPVKKLLVEQDLRGRIIRVNQQWGVIKEIQDGRVWIWGNFGSQNIEKSEFEILPSYHFK